MGWELLFFLPLDLAGGFRYKKKKNTPKVYKFYLLSLLSGPIYGNKRKNTAKFQAKFTF